MCVEVDVITDLLEPDAWHEFTGEHCDDEIRGHSSCCIAAIRCSQPCTSAMGLGVEVELVGAGLGIVGSVSRVGDEFKAS